LWPDPLKMTDISDRVRLHITPFNPDIYDRIVSDSAKAVATGISYHSVQTEPERGFGYIELPRTEADKLKKKIHGFMLKGSKARVEEAKPEKKRKAEREETEEERSEWKKAKKAKKEKAKKEDGVIPGYELENGRHVKRGWTEGKEKKTKTKEQKMLFKTSVPPNAMPLEDEKKSKSKEKKAKKEAEKDGERKNRKTPKVVEEFAKKKHVITSAESNSKAAAEYIEGKGWVDEDGEIVEAEPPSVKRQRALDRALKVAEETRRAEEERQQAEAMDVDVAENSDSVAEELSDGDDDELSDDASSASGDDDEPSEDEGKVQEAKPSTSTSKSPLAEADVSIPSSNFKTPEPEAAREVHPLEALYRRAPNPAAEDAAKHALPAIDTSFSFFNPGDVEEEDDETTSVPTHPPQTPHTKQDLEWRALRSAAPTPDTAGLGKRFRFAIDGAEQDKEDDGESDGDEEMTDAVPSAASVARESGDGEVKDESEFRKWFYEHRGENNRAWKKKRKEAKKQQRQRENRRLTRRVV
jgi:hypothetical protein